VLFSSRAERAYRVVGKNPRHERVFRSHYLKGKKISGLSRKKRRGNRTMNSGSLGKGVLSGDLTLLTSVSEKDFPQKGGAGC